jgi:hypothetical protein
MFFRSPARARVEARNSTGAARATGRAQRGRRAETRAILDFSSCLVEVTKRSRSYYLFLPMYITQIATRGQPVRSTRRHAPIGRTTARIGEAQARAQVQRRPMPGGPPAGQPTTAGWQGWAGGQHGACQRVGLPSHGACRRTLFLAGMTTRAAAPPAGMLPRAAATRPPRLPAKERCPAGGPEGMGLRCTCARAPIFRIREFCHFGRFTRIALGMVFSYASVRLRQDRLFQGVGVGVFREDFRRKPGHLDPNSR